MVGGVLSLVSEWGIYVFMFVFFLFKMTAMETDVLAVIVMYVIPTSDRRLKVHLHNQLRETFGAVFFLPFNMAFSNAMYCLRGSSLWREQ